MEGLAPIDAWAIMAILAKATGYGAALLAIGGPLFVVALPDASRDVRQLARKIAVIAALIGMAVLALRFGVRAARISGMGLTGAVDPMMLGFVWDSPLGTAAVARIFGEVLVILVLIGGVFGQIAGLTGALCIAASFTFVGHSLGDPRWLLSLLLVLHLMAAGFWVGSLIPLWHAAKTTGGAALLHRFGQIAIYTVALLALAGVIFAWLMAGSLTALISTAYGWTLLSKLGVVTGLLGLAALNKWRLVPALASGAPTAARHLRRSIGIEAGAVLIILIVTATLTSVTTPPINL